MSSESAFEKRLTVESKMDKVEGLLEHFNLPPKAIDYIRKNQRIIQISFILVFSLVVFFSLYSSYREGVIEDAASALSVAMESPENERAKSLEQVIEEFGNTDSALWANIELGHLDMANGQYSSSASRYMTILSSVKESNPLYSLLLFSSAQAFEADKKYTDAIGQYNLLKEIPGYEQVGFSGLARIEETQGNFEKALAIFNNFLLNVGDDPSAAQARTEIQPRIARLKGKM